MGLRKAAVRNGGGTVALAADPTPRPHLFKNISAWPPYVYFLIGVALLLVWGLGTSVQVLTSEAWMMSTSLKEINFSAFSQLGDAISGHLSPDMFIPFTFGWGVQFALIVASIGIELPPHPRWRYYGAWGAVILLIGVNSCGDFFSSSKYTFWGQIGFTVVIFFITFCMLLFAIMAFMHTWHLMKQEPAH